MVGCFLTLQLLYLSPTDICQRPFGWERDRELVGVLCWDSLSFGCLSLPSHHLYHSFTTHERKKRERVSEWLRDRWWREGKKGRETLGWNFHSNTHSLTPSLTLFRSFAHSFIHSFFHSLTPSLYLSFPSIIRSFAQSFLPSFIRSFSLSSPSPTSLLIRLWVWERREKERTNERMTERALEREGKERMKEREW